jgi:hypothetical protein
MEKARSGSRSTAPSHPMIAPRTRLRRLRPRPLPFRPVEDVLLLRAAQFHAHRARQLRRTRAPGQLPSCKPRRCARQRQRTEAFRNCVCWSRRPWERGRRLFCGLALNAQRRQGNQFSPRRRDDAENWKDILKSSGADPSPSIPTTRKPRVAGAPAFARRNWSEPNRVGLGSGWHVLGEGAW